MVICYTFNGKLIAIVGIYYKFLSTLKNVLHIIQIAFKLLQQTFETKECFKDIKLIKSQTQLWNLNQVKSNLNEHYRKKCAKPTCPSCVYIKEDRKEYIFLKQ